VVSVRNTGPEIPADQLDRLFQPFQRLGGGLGIDVAFSTG
jgi:signal transduction histidine kinase